jgi:hypothetical protein
VELDHVVVAVSDLDAAALALESRHGLASVVGGRHPAWGTANRIVPLGATYLELVAVVDAGAAAASVFGRWVAGAVDGPLGWVVRVPSLDPVAGRLGLAVGAGSRALPSGGVLRWRVAGIEEAAAEPCLPFVLEWAADAPFPGATPIDHPAGVTRIARLELEGDPERIAGRLGDAALPVSVSPGAPRVARVVLEAARGEVVLAAGS